MICQRRQGMMHYWCISYLHHISSIRFLPTQNIALKYKLNPFFAEYFLLLHSNLQQTCPSYVIDTRMTTSNKFLTTNIWFYSTTQNECFLNGASMHMYIGWQKRTHLIIIILLHNITWYRQYWVSFNWTILFNWWKDAYSVNC